MSGWDVAVVGAGIAGLTAATVVAEHGLRVAACERLAPGGQLINLGEVTGYPGLPAKTGGADLAGSLLETAMAAGVEIVYTEATGLRHGPPHTVSTWDEDLTAPAVVLATGMAPGRLPVPDAESWAGRGVSECASCDGPLYAGQPVAVAGDDEWAAQEAAELAALAGHVTVLVPGAAPRWSPRRSAALTAAGVEIRTSAVVTGLDGDPALRAVHLADGAVVEATGMFVQVGRAPRAELAAGLPTGDGPLSGDTGVPGLFVAGPVRAGVPDHAVTAAADGLVAGLAAVRHVRQGTEERSA